MSGERVFHASRAFLLSLLFSCSVVYGATEFGTDTTIGNGDRTYDGDDITVNDCTVTMDGAHLFSSLTIANGGTVTCSDTSGMFLRVKGNMTIQAGASINVDGMGYSPGDGEGAGRDGRNAGGSGHGGKGGPGDGDAYGGEAYDRQDDPSKPGSGGGTGRYNNSIAAGGFGGGFVRIVVDGQLRLDGEISADGISGVQGQIGNTPKDRVVWSGGGGAGGAIRIDCNAFSGSGDMTTGGGNAGWIADAGSGGGGGGIIALYYMSSTFIGPISASGGDGGGRSDAEGKPLHQGANGTVRINGTFAASIKSPATGSKRVAGRMIRFEASHMYGLPPFTYAWSFSKERDGETGIGGKLGEGEILEAPLSEGEYTITLSGTDASGATSEAKIALVAISPETAYSAAVQADVGTAPAGTPVTFAGQAIWVDDTPAAGMDVVLHIVTRGMKRERRQVSTDEDGTFKTVWQPLAREAGRYFISADRPNVTDEPPEDEFVLFGAAVEPNDVDHRVLAGQRIERSVIIRNLGDIELSGLSARVENAPANLVIEPNCPNTLGPKAGAPLKYSVRAIDASVQDTQFHVVVSRGQTPVATLHVYVEVVPNSAVLEAYPQEITAGMVRGDQTLLDVEVVNLGGASSDALTVCLPEDAAWMSLVTPETIGPLEPNERTTVTLSLRPEAAMLLAPYDGNLVVGDGQAEVTVPFHLDCVSAAVGSLAVTAVDELTFYAPGEPKLAGAHVKVIDGQTGQLVGSVDANDRGVAEFPDLPDAYYSVEVAADGHETFRTMRRVSAGSRAELTALLPRQLVTYRWTVLSDQTEGRYYFQVEADSVTDAPAPVVTVEPLLLNLCQLTAEDTDVKYTFTNDGLLAARNVTLTFRDVAGFEFIPLVDAIDLPAGTSVEVPVRIHNSNLSAGVSGPCDGRNPCEVGAHELSYNLRCGDDDLLYRTPFFAKAGAGVCYQPPPGGGIVGTGPGVGIARDSGPVDQVVRCPSCDARVRIRIDRNTMLAGNAFITTLELDNSGSTIPLEKVKIALAIRDEQGTPSEYLFDIEPPQVAGIEDVSGAGSLPAGQSLAAQWLIAPAPYAACGEPQRYDVGGELSYAVDGETFTMVLYPTPITVLPNPQLAVKYFLERDISGDDPLTDSIEPAAPFSLGVMVANHGCGAASDVQIVSSQPRIVGDDEGRPIDFKIVGTRVGRDAIAPVLNAKLGDIQPEANRVVHWLMQSSLQGRFEQYRAGFMHIDGLGDKRLAMIGEAPIHELSHVVRVLCPNDDGIPDFLTSSPDTHLPDAVHLSDGSVRPVAATPHALSRIAVLGNHVYLTVPGASADYFYVQFPDSSLFALPLKAVARSDGVAIPIGENVWTTRRLVLTQGQPPYEESLLHLFDCGGPGTYILDYSNLPPLKVEVRYFLERRIYGDDPFTKEVEPAAPFSLGLIVRNQGYATAKDVWIVASPPEIVDHANRRLPDPNVVAVSIGPNDVSPSLQIKIGDLEVNESRVIHWVMQSSFQGRLESWNVEFVQVDGFGGRYPLDASSFSVHELERAVRFTWSGDDGACDFLTRESRNTYGLPDTLYLSDGSVWPEPVIGLVRMVHELVRIRDHFQIRLAVVGVPDGPFYVRYPDPTEGKLKLVAVTRSDGVSIPVGPNAWTTRRTVREPPWQPYEESLLHLFDYGGPGSYTFEYELGDWKSLPSDEP